MVAWLHTESNEDYDSVNFTLREFNWQTCRVYFVVFDSFRSDSLSLTMRPSSTLAKDRTSWMTTSSGEIERRWTPATVIHDSCLTRRHLVTRPPQSASARCRGLIRTAPCRSEDRRLRTPRANTRHWVRQQLTTLRRCQESALSRQAKTTHRTIHCTERRLNSSTDCCSKTTIQTWSSTGRAVIPTQLCQAWVMMDCARRRHSNGRGTAFWLWLWLCSLRFNSHKIHLPPIVTAFDFSQ